MKRRVLYAILISAVAGTTAFAGEQLAFDSMGIMMLEHEAEEAVQGKTLPSLEVQAQRCEEKEQALQIRMLELKSTLSENYSTAFSYLNTAQRQAFEEQAEVMANRFEAMQNDPAIKLQAARGLVAEHRKRLNTYRDAFQDEALLEQVQEALALAEKVIAKN